MDLIVHRATPAELERVVPAYGAAFADEAVARWVTSGRQLPDAVFRDVVREALRADEVLVAQRADGTIEGLSVWLTLRSAERVRREAAVLAESAGTDPVLRRMATVMTLAAQRHPDEPHLFLSSMGGSPRAAEAASEARSCGTGSTEPMPRRSRRTWKRVRRATRPSTRDTASSRWASRSNSPKTAPDCNPCGARAADLGTARWDQKPLPDKGFRSAEIRRPRA
ncbi:hypothetical protein AB0I53_36235 [Saccharopolyspora sp. NPDC050389]|uniref:hypothetical protein n=1 Tax=Saccharopolyspora sp. NPDC050389 TaxID=3155516 RepID=UPI0033DE6C2F